MRQKITIRIPTKNSDGEGGNYTTFTTVSYWCDIEEKPINKTFDNGQTVYGKAYQVLLRNTGIVPDITLEYKFTYNGRDLEIMSEVTTKSRAFRVFMCEYAS
jgi:hypothetical protein